MLVVPPHIEMPIFLDSEWGRATASMEWGIKGTGMALI